MVSQKVNIPFYLKYRPQSLDDLIGQEIVKKTLTASFKNNKLSHAYLFVGPRGTGKTSTARILAKMVNDEPTNQLTMNVPCNKCSSCLSITDGSNLDLIEIDAASNRGIEDIRSLRAGIKLAPTSSTKKVYIIDEVHMLTTEAFNALLKTLEEPPAHALFILATTDVSKIPPTILSRVQRLDFKLATPSEIGKALSKIIQKEKIDIDEEAIKLLIKRAEGSFRDGVKLLDQIASLGGKITAGVLEEALKSSQFDDLLNLLHLLLEKDSTNALLKLVKLSEKGEDSKNVTLSLMDLLRNVFFIKNGLGQNVEPLYTEDKYDQLIKLSEKFEDKRLVGALEILQKTMEQLKFASIPYLPLELAIVEICGSEDSENSVSQIKSDTPEHQKIGMNKIQNSESEISDSSDIQKLQEKWTFVLETVRPYNFSLEALLRSIKISGCTNEQVIMEVPYSFHQRILEAPKNKGILESILSDILGRSIRITTVLGVRPQRKEDIENIEVAQDDEIIRIASEIFNSETVN